MVGLRRVVVLGGGGSRRLGRDKLAVDLGGRTVLQHLLDGLALQAPGVQVVVVGTPRPVEFPVTWRLEEPPGGGPVAGIAAGLSTATDLTDLDDLTDLTDLDDEDVVAVVAGDQPFGASGLPVLLAALGPDVDGVLAVDGSGREQPLLGVYRVGPLRRAIGSQPAGRRVRDVVRALRLGRVRVIPAASLDVDTEADVEAARAVVERSG